MAISCPALIESRLEYAAGTLILLARWVLRLQTLGIRAWHWDDWFSVSVFVWHSALFGMVEYLAVVGAPLGFSQEMSEALTPEMRVQLEKGAKALYATFFILICFVWSAKAVLIAFFLQLTYAGPPRTGVLSHYLPVLTAPQASHANEYVRVVHGWCGWRLLRGGLYDDVPPLSSHTEELANPAGPRVGVLDWCEPEHCHFRWQCACGRITACGARPHPATCEHGALAPPGHCVPVVVGSLCHGHSHCTMHPLR
jgi:hypothetical protein